MEVYQQAINANPHNLDNYLKIARLQIFTSQLEQAQVNAQNAILLDNNSSEAYALLGWAKAFQREYLAGEADLRKAVELNQNSGLAHAIYAYVLALRVEARMDDLDTMDRAIEESRTALALEPNLMEAHWARGYVLEVTANFAEAVESLKIANQINPPNVDRLHMALGRNLTYIDQLDQAVFEFTKAYSLNPPTSPRRTWLSRRFTADWVSSTKPFSTAKSPCAMDPPSQPLRQPGYALLSKIAIQHRH